MSGLLALPNRGQLHQQQKKNRYKIVNIVQECVGGLHFITGFHLPVKNQTTTMTTTIDSV